jgi:hypothetical protein
MTLLAEQTSPIAVVIFLVIVVLVVMAVIYGVQAAHKRDAELEQLARRLGGNLQPSSLFHYPELRIPHLGLTATLKYTAGGENESNRTHLTIPWSNGDLRCEIFMEGPFSGLRKLIGMQDIEIGSPDFDRRFVITGNDESAIKAFLTPDSQARLLDLMRVDVPTAFSVPNLYLRIGHGLLTVTKASYLTDIEIVDRFIRLFLAFYEAASADPAGIEFLGAVSVQSAAVSGEAIPHCIVCGEALRTDLVTCRSCRTPHHKDCWQYFGGCATYACGGKQFVPAKASGGR